MDEVIATEVQPAKEKEEKLKEYLEKLGAVLIAYSGGVDSTYLMTIAREVLAELAQAVLVKGAMLSQAERRTPSVWPRAWISP